MRTRLIRFSEEKYQPPSTLAKYLLPEHYLIPNVVEGRLKGSMRTNAFTERTSEARVKGVRETLTEVKENLLAIDWVW